MAIDHISVNGLLGQLQAFSHLIKKKRHPAVIEE